MGIPVRYVKGIGPKREKLLNRLGIFSLRDLFYYFPVRYQDRTKIDQVSILEEGASALIQAEVATLNSRSAFYGRKTVVEAMLRDESGVIGSVWFNQPYVKDYLKIGKTYCFYGRIARYKEKLQIVAPEFESLESEDGGDISGIVPFYRLTQRLTQSALRKLVRASLGTYSKEITEPLPFEIRKQYNFPNILAALNSIHVPQGFKDLSQARQRFIFEEFFIMQILLYRRKAEFRLHKREPLGLDEEVLEKVKSNFGFTLTKDQEKVTKDILADLTSPYRSWRLLQGDVGSGKTIVAALAASCVAKAGLQAAFMVPTEVLALQHKDTLRALTKGLGIKVDILTSAVSAKKRAELYKRLAQGKVDIIVGTHALLDQELKFKDLRLIVIDEQHRFGVAQRAILAHKGINPDILVMSATPIPRSLALTLYGDLEVSLIKQYPQGHKLAQSRIVNESQRVQVHGFIRDKIKEGRQAFIIYALVEDSVQDDLYSAVQMYEELTKEFKPLRLGLLHGRLDSNQKQTVLEKFKNKDIDILVSTLVVEVGIDVPNATVMVVENPERFGLAQLHQLRGRIMRSTLDSYFFMVAKKNIAVSSRKRLEVIAKTQDGFKIAEEDLNLRGPGDLFGTIQAGYLPKSIASVEQDMKMLESARREAFAIIKNDPYLESHQNQSLKESIKDLLDKSLFWQAS